MTKPHSFNQFQVMASVSRKLIEDLDRLTDILAQVGTNEILAKLQEQSLRLKEHLVVLRDLTQPDDETTDKVEDENRENTRRARGAGHR